MDGPGKHFRNAAIVVALACIVWLVPGGGTASSVIANLLGVILLAGLSFFGYRMYMEHRTDLFMLEDRQRGILYGSLGLAVLTVVATRRMWDSGGGFALLWFVFLGAASYGVFYVFKTSREY